MSIFESGSKRAKELHLPIERLVSSKLNVAYLEELNCRGSLKKRKIIIRKRNCGTRMSTHQCQRHSPYGCQNQDHQTWWHNKWCWALWSSFMNIRLAGVHMWKGKGQGNRRELKEKQERRNSATSRNILKSSNSASSVGGVICAPGALTLSAREQARLWTCPIFLTIELPWIVGAHCTVHLGLFNLVQCIHTLKCPKSDLTAIKTLTLYLAQSKLNNLLPIFYGWRKFSVIYDHCFVVNVKKC